MYSTCIFCNGSLGSNRAIESFPVGRRLAFDEKRGRLWVVCVRCARWNLSAIEERWEAIEECERRFRGTRLRVSTDNVGLCRLGEGLELVRVGEPLRPEFAAWRYGREYGLRRRRALAWAGAGATAAAGVAASVATGGMLLPALLIGGTIATFPAVAWFRHERPVLRLRHHGTENYDVRRVDLPNARLAVSARGEGWRLLVGHRFGALALEGDEALRALRNLLPRLNGRGARAAVVRDAVTRATRFDDRASLFAFAARIAERESGVWRTELMARSAAEPDTEAGLGLAELVERGTPNNPGALAAFTPEFRLSLEMALHEEQERRAMDGELAQLQQAWREAEEIARIADELLLPEGVTEWLQRQREPDVGVPRAT